MLPDFERADRIGEFWGYPEAAPAAFSFVKSSFPAPLAEDARGRVWSRHEVQAWARRWRGEKPWR
jgi:hypothetical protein